jgi:outer membrane protein
VTKALPTGDTFSIEQDIVRSSGSSGSSTYPASYTGALAYSYSRPLFRNATRAINLASVEQARNNVTLAQVQLRVAEVGVRGAVTQAYWDVVNKSRTLKVREADIDLLKGLLDMNVERYKVGLAVKTDVLQAESALYAQQASAEQAKVDFENSKDALKLIIGIDTDVSVAEPEALPPGQQPQSLSPDLVDRAKGNDTNLQQLLTQLRNAHLSRLVLKNQLRPDVNLQAKYSKEGIDANNPDVLSTMHSPSVSIGVVYNFDLGQRKAKGDLATEELNIADLSEQIAARGEQVQTTLASTVRQLRQSAATVAAQQKSVDSARENYYATKERLLNGLATTLDVVQAEQNLLQAELGLVTAQIGQLTLARQLATLLGEA